MIKGVTFLSIRSVSYYPSSVVRLQHTLLMRNVKAEVETVYYLIYWLSLKFSGSPPSSFRPCSTACSTTSSTMELIEEQWSPPLASTDILSDSWMG